MYFSGILIMQSIESHPRGRPRLRNALAASYSPEFNRSLDPETEILVTAGANEAMFATFAAYLDEGSEVICMEPFFDQYIVSWHPFIITRYFPSSILKTYATLCYNRIVQHYHERRQTCVCPSSCSRICCRTNHLFS